MRKSLKALADRIEGWLATQTPAQVEKLRAKVDSAKMQRQWGRQQQLREQVQQWQQQQQQQHCTGSLGGAARVYASAGGLGSSTTSAAAAEAAPAATAGAQHGAGLDGGLSCGTGAPHAVQYAVSPAVAGSSGSSSSRVVGRKRPHSSSGGDEAGCRRSRGWSENTLWLLQNYCLFHTSWSSPKSPAYNGQLLEEVVQELFGFKLRGPAD